MREGRVIAPSRIPEEAPGLKKWKLINQLTDE